MAEKFYKINSTMFNLLMSDKNVHNRLFGLRAPITKKETLCNYESSSQGAVK